MFHINSLFPEAIIPVKLNAFYALHFSVLCGAVVCSSVLSMARSDSISMESHIIELGL
jgi:hypothetical protein